MGLINTDATISVYSPTVTDDLAWRESFYMPRPPAVSALWGIQSVVAETGTLADVAATGTNLFGRSCTTTTTVNTTSGAIAGANDNWYNISQNIQSQIQLSQSAIAARRIWVGFIATTVANMAASDTPSQSYFAFRYSTTASDTTWQCMADNGSGSPTKVDSGITVGTGQTLLGFVVRSVVPAVDYYVAGIKVGTITATLPSTATSTLQPFIALNNNTAGTTRAFTYYFFNIRAKVI